MTNQTLALFNLGTPEFIFIAILALVIFGRRLPEVARSLGKSVVEFKKGLNEVKDDVKTIHTEAAKPLPPADHTHTSA